MSKLFLIAIIVLAALAVVTGVVEVRLNTEKLGDIPATIQKAIGGKDLLAQGEYYLTGWKRKAELATTNGDDKKFELHVKYVEADTTSLKDALDANAQAAGIILKSKRLTESVNDAKAAANAVSEDTIARMRDTWLKALAEANVQLARLSGLAGEYEKYQKQLETLAPSATPEAASPSPQEGAIPLKF